jgi:hypothetical protein
MGNRTMVVPPDTGSSSNIDILHEIGSRFAASDPLHTVLERVLQFVTPSFSAIRVSFTCWRTTRWCCGRRRIRTPTWWIG